jgi:hypothetical protein
MLLESMSRDQLIHAYRSAAMSVRLCDQAFRTNESLTGLVPALAGGAQA